MRQTGICLSSVESSLAGRTGLRAGNRVLKVNGSPVEDELDFRFLLTGGQEVLEVQSEGTRQLRTLRLRHAEARALSFEPMRVRRCRNRCLFCFVDQLPQGLRKTLYVKDEDYRFSFLYGNYVTLSCLSDAELERILRLKLSPLYVSVHATEPRTRNLILGRRWSRDILETLRVLTGGGICLHAQIVLCPGINDGETLERTVADLADLHPGLASIAVVPVGLTRYRGSGAGNRLQGFSPSGCMKIIKQGNQIQSGLKVKYGNNFFYLADEFYLKGSIPVPAAWHYDDFPQWENGVGMMALFQQEWEHRRRRQRRKPATAGPAVAVTGELPYPHLLPYVRWLGVERKALVDLVPVRNRFFGRRVTVTGLVTGQDILRRLEGRTAGARMLLVPEVMLSREGMRFLDDLSLEDLSVTLKLPVQHFRPDPAGFEKALESL